jgi:hypothetical protein
MAPVKTGRPNGLISSCRRLPISTRQNPSGHNRLRRSWWRWASGSNRPTESHSETLAPILVLDPREGLQAAIEFKGSSSPAAIGKDALDAFPTRAASPRHLSGGRRKSSKADLMRPGVLSTCVRRLASPDDYGRRPASGTIGAIEAALRPPKQPSLNPEQFSKSPTPSDLSIAFDRHPRF